MELGRAADNVGGAGNGGPAVRADILDTRVLGKPDSFAGDQKAWRDWSIVMRSYAGLVDNGLSVLMKNYLLFLLTLFLCWL